MNESSVTAPFIKKLREAIPDAEIIKTHDVSTIGIPDLSITYAGREFKLEFKLWTPLHSWDGSPHTVPVEKIAAKSPVQLALMKRYAKAASFALYMVWVRKSNCIVFWSPLEPEGWLSVRTTAEAVDLISILIRKWVN